jgi:hypothetical protein
VVPRAKTPIPLASKRQLRRLDYKRVQTLYRKDRKRAAELILSGSWRGTAGEPKMDKAVLVNFWREVFESQRKSDVRESVQTESLPEMVDEVSVAEATAQLKSLTRTAPGPDGTSNDTFRSQDPIVTASFLNALLMAGSSPPSFLASRTLLIPKVKSPLDPGGYRPISVSNVGCRLFHKVLAQIGLDSLSKST